MKKTTYSEKLKNPLWQKKRLEILQRDEWSCSICGDNENTLHVHHRRYIPGKEPWEIPNELLVTLCESCHELETIEMPEAIAMLTDIIKEKFFSGEVKRIAQGFYNMGAVNTEPFSSIIEYFLSTPEMRELMWTKYFDHFDKSRSPF